MDEEATVDLISETGVWQPVLKPESELWLDVALVFDTSPSMCLWQRFGADLHRLLARYGEFRDVRIWFLEHKTSKVTLTSRNRRPRKLNELLTGDRRRLIVIVSDCIAPAWHNGAMRDLIGVWSAKLPTVVFHVFPERLWSRTALARSVTVEFKGKRDGLPSDKLQPTSRSVWDRDRLEASLNQPTVHLPVVTLEPDSLSSWAKMVAGDRRSRVLGIVWDAPPLQPKASSQSSAPSAPSITDRIDTFLLTASPISRQLAALLVSAPVITLPIVRLIKQTNLSQASAVHMAEVFMSGLLKVSGTHKPTFENAERIAYELVDGEVRDRLRAGSRVADALTIYTKVSEYVAQGLGKSVSDFWALLRTPAKGKSSEETEFLDAFATVTAKILRGLGSEFEAIADSLYPLPAEAESGLEEEDTFPGLRTLEYSTSQIERTKIIPEFPLIQTKDVRVVTITPSDIPSIETEPFSFEVATIEREGSEEPWTVQRQSQQAHRYIEPLGNGVSIAMVAIPGGRFVMGSPEDEPERNDNEGPQHEVQVQGFFMGRYPITQAQWKEVAGFPEVNRSLNPEPSVFKGENRPVEYVSWHDAVEFCARLSAHTQQDYRLPTEAEWEYACRAGTTTPFHFGEMINTDVVNYNGSSYNDGLKGQRRRKTTPVDQFKVANSFGLSDMHGNVLEWCQDHWHQDYEGAPTDGSAWITGGDASKLVLRGGSWDTYPRPCRSASRFYSQPVNFLNTIGFRVVCVARRAL